MLRLKHILDSISKIEIVTENLQYGDYLEDWQRQDIIIRNMEIIGEASRHISEKIKTKYPEVAWRNASAMRNYLIHEYFNVNYAEVWQTLKQDLPIYKTQIQEIIQNL